MDDLNRHVLYACVSYEVLKFIKGRSRKFEAESIDLGSKNRSEKTQSCLAVFQRQSRGFKGHKEWLSDIVYCMNHSEMILQHETPR